MDSKATQGHQLPKFSFAVVADVQYADVDDAYDFHKTALRRYRNALNVFERAVEGLKAHHHKYVSRDNQATGNSKCRISSQGEDIDPYAIRFVAQMGDLLDYQCHGNSEHENGEELRAGVRSVNGTSTYLQP